ncbi:hypothetical protein BH10BAC5_BH10BAC5_09500 [soil metagenome]
MLLSGIPLIDVKSYFEHIILKNFFVYILTNKKNGSLYIGVTNDLLKRVYEHKQKIVKGFPYK